MPATSAATASDEHERRLDEDAIVRSRLAPISAKPFAGVPGGGADGEAGEREQAAEREHAVPTPRSGESPATGTSSTAATQRRRRDGRREPVDERRPLDVDARSRHSRRSSRYGCSGDGPRRPCRRAFQCWTSPGSSGASATPPTSWTRGRRGGSTAHPISPEPHRSEEDDDERDQVRRRTRSGFRSAGVARVARAHEPDARDRAVERASRTGAGPGPRSAPPGRRRRAPTARRSRARAQHGLEHEPQRLREPGARPRERGLRRAARRPSSAPARHAAGPRATARSATATSRTSDDARGRQRVVPRHVERRARRVVRRPGREAGERPGEQPGDDPEHDAGRGEDRDGAPASGTAPRRPPRPAAAAAGRAARARPPSRSRAPRAPRSRRARRARPRPPSPSATPPFAGTASSDWSVSHSDANPFSGGSPAIAIAPTRNAPPVHGIRRSRPPSRSISSEPAARSNAPAPRNSSPLKTAWLSVCRSAAASATPAHSSAPRACRRRHAPSPSTMIPTFSIEWNASSRFSSCWKIA